MSRGLRLSSSILALALLCGIITFSWRGSYARYFLDDYCTAADLHEFGFAGAMKHHRESWSGRYSYFAFKAALESIGAATARVTPTLLLLLLAWSFWRTSRPLIPERAAASVAALACTFTIFDASPSMLNADETWFWETGYVTYVLPLVFFTMWLRLFVVKGSTARAIAASGLLMFIAGGLSETSLAAQGVLTGGMLVVALAVRDRRGMWISLTGLIATLSALAIVVTAPGNAVRASMLPPPISIPEAAMRALRFANGFIGSYVFLAGAAFLVAFGAGLLAGFVSPRIRPRRAMAFAAVALAAYAVSFFPSARLLPTPPPPASLDVASYFLMLAIIGAGSATGRLMADRGFRAAPGVMVVVLLSTIVPLWSAAANVRAIPGEREKAARMDALDALLRKSRGQDVVVQERWPLARHILFADADHWANRCVSRYYGLRSVRVAR